MSDNPIWRCFHCAEVFTQEDDAADHFGIEDGIMPLCLEVDKPSLILKRMRDRGWAPPAVVAAKERKEERLQFIIEGFEWRQMTDKRLFAKMGGAQSLHDAEDNYDCLQFRYDQFLNVPTCIRWLVRLVAATQKKLSSFRRLLQNPTFFRTRPAK